MFHLRSIGVLSCAKIFAVVQAAIGVLVGFFFLVFGAIGAALVPGQRKLGMLGIIIIAVLMPIFYGILGFVLGAIWAFVYNFAAQTIGGLELDLQGILPAPLEARPYPPQPQ
jgi:hypothetical protein